jgi:hypothetical protein
MEETMDDETTERQSPTPTVADPATPADNEPAGEAQNDTANPRWWENQQGSGEVH